MVNTSCNTCQAMDRDYCIGLQVIVYCDVYMRQ